MNELRFVRREERSLILATENDDEFRLVIDDLLIAELKHASRKEREGAKVRPREIQSLVRAGKSRSEIAAITGLEESDIERYEEPVLAERRYILERAHAVQVRTEASEESDQRFGAVIGERLIGLEADASEWTAWRDEEAGWLVSLEFISHDVAHNALWSFDHRKQTLAPINPDAVNLSKQGDVGDRLIPKLRAVDNGDRTSQFPPVTDASSASAASAAPSTLAARAEKPSTPAKPAVAQLTAARDAAPAPEAEAAEASVASTPAEQAAAERTAAPLDANAEYARRREIDQRAIKSDDSGPVDFSQTADLLDALRRRRGERQLAQAQDPDDTETSPITAPPVSIPVSAKPEPATAPAAEPNAAAPAAPAVKKPRSIWGGAGVASGVTQAKLGAPEAPSAAAPANPPAAPAAATAPEQSPAAATPEAPATSVATASTSTASTSTPQAGPKKGRASIPSWDDILFGTRSDDGPRA
ncbi:septation protein SepH [Leucobacter sp. HY1908]